MSEPRPYTYVTLSLQPDSAPHVGVSFHTSRLKVRAGLLLSSPRPYLDFASCEANVHISTTGAGQVTEDDLTLARDIFNAAARYLADCEQLHAEQSAKDATDTAA
ncbi:unnamed protein product [[Actinomadura] parvosata subsp. kistnae]|uniref:Uncharacterized protein n=1 Tax=[Actinomadura] parvosata subsp. kistnae TaxID=1909395 RepID=A0A1V0AAL7_9ACTN|nr:hypothetical protein [Nonomuraea sp. ATCC 55076]AQZ67237.1 hypothetical protein BKM31_42460 [Nonomuraea sp. ATCC 55076]SPL94546.1 unnamed protein product [Actinomadura parvosata subsp. kistnae]